MVHAHHRLDGNSVLILGCGAATISDVATTHEWHNAIKEILGTHIENLKSS